MDKIEVVLVGKILLRYEDGELAARVPGGKRAVLDDPIHARVCDMLDELILVLREMPYEVQD